MRILQVHNQYRIRGGECRVVDTERTLLQRAGHTVELFGRRSADLEGSSALRRLEGLARTPWNRATARALAGVVRRDRPDVAHVHNVFPLISPSVYAVLAALGVPVVQTVPGFPGVQTVSRSPGRPGGPRSPGRHGVIPRRPLCPHGSIHGIMPYES